MVRLGGVFYRAYVVGSRWCIVIFYAKVLTYLMLTYNMQLIVSCLWTIWVSRGIVLAVLFYACIITFLEIDNRRSDRARAHDTESPMRAFSTKLDS